MIVGNNNPVSLFDVPSTFPEEGLSRQILACSERMMLVRHLMQRGWVGAKHSHPHEQLVYVIRGRLRVTAGKLTFEVASGDSFVVPGGIEHQASAMEESEVLDIFTPFRQDYVTVDASME
jgi:quercetin dioxygenase-like cupin family protein